MTVRATTREELRDAVVAMRSHPRTSVVVVEVDLNQRVPGYESWWDVPIAEVSEMQSVQAAHAAYVESKRKERYFF
jgi:3D-(3,5/4)-trihydroxycyclohexane-1,2-dione acylhydrolase (decyclizing)